MEGRLFLVTIPVRGYDACKVPGVLYKYSTERYMYFADANKPQNWQILLQISNKTAKSVIANRFGVSEDCVKVADELVPDNSHFMQKSSHKFERVAYEVLHGVKNRYEVADITFKDNMKGKGHPESKYMFLARVELLSIKYGLYGAKNKLFASVLVKGMSLEKAYKYEGLTEYDKNLLSFYRQLFLSKRQKPLTSSYSIFAGETFDDARKQAKHAIKNTVVDMNGRSIEEMNNLPYHVITKSDDIWEYDGQPVIIWNSFADGINYNDIIVEIEDNESLSQKMNYICCSKADASAIKREFHDLATNENEDIDKHHSLLMDYDFCEKAN